MKSNDMKSVSIFIILVYLCFPAACFAQSDPRDIQAASETDFFWISDDSDKRGLDTVQSDGCFDEHTATGLPSVHFFPAVGMHDVPMNVTLQHVSIPIFVPPQNRV